MIATLVFCVCVTILSCYTLHTVLADTSEERKNTEASRIMAEIDLLALKKPLKIEKTKTEKTKNFLVHRNIYSP